MSTEEKITKLFAEAEVNLLEDLEDFDMVGNGFWETLLKQTLEIIQTSDKWRQNNE